MLWGLLITTSNAQYGRLDVGFSANCTVGNAVLVPGQTNTWTISVFSIIDNTAYPDQGAITETDIRLGDRFIIQSNLNTYQVISLSGGIRVQGVEPEYITPPVGPCLLYRPINGYIPIEAGIDPNIFAAAVSHNTMLNSRKNIVTVVYQLGHGFTTLDRVTHNGTQWVGVTDISQEHYGVVNVIDANTFELHTSGVIKTPNELTVRNMYATASSDAPSQTVSGIKVGWFDGQEGFHVEKTISGGANASGCYSTVTQTAHGFSTLDRVRKTTVWVAVTDTLIEHSGIVEVIDANTFRVYSCGIISVPSNTTAYYAYPIQNSASNGDVPISTMKLGWFDGQGQFHVEKVLNPYIFGTPLAGNLTVQNTTPTSPAVLTLRHSAASDLAYESAIEFRRLTGQSLGSIGKDATSLDMFWKSTYGITLRPGNVTRFSIDASGVSNFNGPVQMTESNSITDISVDLVVPDSLKRPRKILALGPNNIMYYAHNIESGRLTIVPTNTSANVTYQVIESDEHIYVDLDSVNATGNIIVRLPRTRTADAIDPGFKVKVTFTGVASYAGGFSVRGHVSDQAVSFISANLVTTDPSAPTTGIFTFLDEVDMSTAASYNFIRTNKTYTFQYIRNNQWIVY